jgi:hypothetical protein
MAILSSAKSGTTAGTATTRNTVAASRELRSTGGDGLSSSAELDVAARCPGQDCQQGFRKARAFQSA